MNSTRLNRRRCLCGLAGLAVLPLLHACGDKAEVSAAPREIDAGTACELDGMLLADYGGPKAQIHYAGLAAPQFYCDTVEMFSVLLRPEQVRPLRAVYTQDMGSADWDSPRGHWIDARQAWYVHGSRRRGAMGRTIPGFAQEDAARRFAEHWGGRVLRYAEVTPQMVDLNGGTQGDGRM